MLITMLYGKKPQSIKISAIIDNNSCVDAIHSTSQDDKRLKIEIGVLKELMSTKMTDKVSWVPGSGQLADVLTKRGASGISLLEILHTGQLSK